MTPPDARLDHPTPPATAWSVRLPGDARRLTFTPLDLVAHLELVHGWFQQSHVAPWWQLAGPLAGSRRYLAGQLALDHLQPWVVAAGGDPFGYVETYLPIEDPLAGAVAQAIAAGHLPADAALSSADRAWHVLVGPPGALGTGVARLLGRAVLARALTDPTVDRVVCEPDERNVRMVRHCASLGHQDLGHLRFGAKVAALLACTRTAFGERFPGDHDAVAAAIAGGRP